ncbi:MAG TPA: Gfo/Idh/MocA family oxidoreductase [Verrucomicrobiae bacterium]|nr:Gfo/Idh/MocA family oxidoreductase [Verrucomicrobiae bacterium]
METRLTDRRGFLAAAGGSAAVAAIGGGLRAEEAKPQAAAPSGPKVKFGLIGCGNRGRLIAKLFGQHGGFDVVAGADYFQDRVDELGKEMNVPADRLYTGLNGYKRLLESDVDAVAIETPPYFHPQQAADAVAAGKHVYVAKPIAVDVPGCQSVAASGQKATEKKRVFLIDFQTRADDFFIEALKRVHDGALGELAFGEAVYHAECPFKRMYEGLQKPNPTAEDRLRAWGLDKVLSGDIITEQNIHTLDVMNWIMGNQPPLWADGTGGRSQRPVGDCWDHFVCMFQYPKNVGITFSSRQMTGHGTKPDGIRNRMFGTKGVLETEYGGGVLIRGENFYRGGENRQIYRTGIVANIATFYKAITGGDYSNQTVVPSVRSNLITLLGRKAAYTGERVTWEALMQDETRLAFDTEGMKA